MQLAPWQSRRIIEFVDAHLAERVQHIELAALARLSESHLSRTFHADFGEPLRVYVIRRRVERAKAMLIETDDPLNLVAIRCGFSDQAHMTRMFRRFAATTPRQWRRENKP